MTGGSIYGPCTVRRSAVPPDGVPGLHQCDPRRISAAGTTLRGRVSSPYGGVAPRWEAPDRPPFQRVPELSLTGPRGSVAVYPYSDTSRTYAPNSRIYGYIKNRFPLSLATVKPRFYVSKFGQRTEVTL